MASSKKKTEIRLAPKNLDKFLFNNYREEERLQQRLRDLTNKGRMRGLELEREKVHVHNEMRLSQRRHSSPMVAYLAAEQRQPRASRPQTRDQTGPNSMRFQRRRASSGSVDTVNEYLLNEFKRVSEVIPAILSSLNKEEGGKKEQEEQSHRPSKSKPTATAPGSRSSLALPIVRLDPDLKAFAATLSGKSKDNPNIGNIVTLINTIKSMREDMAGNKRFDVTRSKLSFPEMLKNIHEEGHKESESDTFTDGTCVLLKRKMNKARRGSCPTVDTTLQQGGSGEGGQQQQPRGLSRSQTTLSLCGKGSSRELDVRAMLQEDLRQLTHRKMATEMQRYEDIRARIGSFLHDVERRRPSIQKADSMLEEGPPL